MNPSHRPHLAVLSVFAAVSLLLFPAALSGQGKTEGRLTTYRLQPMDLVKIQVFQEPDLEREIRVSKDSSIVLPLVGRVDVSSRSLREVEQFVTALYAKDYLVNPQINITVIEYAQRTVNVLGAINSPGSVPIPPEKDLTLLDAVARCGGFSRLANRARISLTRTFADGHSENFTVNADQVMSGDGAQRWTLKSGDVVYVPERVL